MRYICISFNVDVTRCNGDMVENMKVLNTTWWQNLVSENYENLNLKIQPDSFCIDMKDQ